MVTEVNFEPVQYIIRGYDCENGYEEKKPYTFVAVLQIINRTTAYIHATHGSMTKDLRKLIQTKCKEIGLDTVIVNRHGSEKIYHI